MLTFDAAMLAELDAGVASWAHLFEFAFSDGTERVWSGDHILEWNSQTWTPATITEYDRFDYTQEVAAKPWVITLSARDPAWLVRVLDPARVNGRLMTVRIAMVNRTAGGLHPTPIDVFVRKMLAGPYNRTQELFTIIARHPFAAGARGGHRTRSHEDQLAYAADELGIANDECFIDVTSAPNTRSPWPGKDYVQKRR